MLNITPQLWYDDNAEEAVNFYLSIFKNSKIISTAYYRGKEAEKVSGRPEGSVMYIIFELDGKKIMAMNGGPYFKLSEATAFIIECKDQEEIDYYWEKLSAGGEKSVCGWLKDKFGLSWVVDPIIMQKFMVDPDKKKVESVMNAMLKMKKIDLKALQEAYDKA